MFIDILAYLTDSLTIVVVRDDKRRYYHNVTDETVKRLNRLFVSLSSGAYQAKTYAVIHSDRTPGFMVSYKKGM
jgi:RNA:NAD 2'-phosphotransferase (TPT1/KptA family)